MGIFESDIEKKANKRRKKLAELLDGKITSKVNLKKLTKVILCNSDNPNKYIEISFKEDLRLRHVFNIIDSEKYTKINVNKDGALEVFAYTRDFQKAEAEIHEDEYKQLKKRIYYPWHE